MLTIILIITVPLLMWGVCAVVVRIVPPPATHLPETTDSPSRQLYKMGPSRVRLDRERDGTWVRTETFKCPKSGNSYIRTTRG